MRVRLLLPRRRRGAGLRGLAAAGLGVVAVTLLAACGGGERTAATTAAAPPPPPAFAVGIDERNPHLIAPGPQPPGYARFRDALAALRPTYVRVQVNWAAYQPAAGRPPDWALVRDGCSRAVPPCAPWNGIRDVLRAVRALGATPVLLVYGTPAWAARPPRGCEPDGVGPEARMPRLGPYRAMLRSLLALGRSEGIDLPYWAPWNEPNTPTFLNPQRERCDAGAPSLAAREYARLVRAAAGEIGLGRLLLGEASGIERHTRATGAAELARDLPDDLVCGAAAWAQHAYVSVPRGDARRLEAVPAAQTDALLAAVEAALDSHRCSQPVPVWITETAAGDRPGACAAMAAQLRTWRRDPRVRAAFAYTLRTDPYFPVGLADAALTRLYPAYEAWRTRGATRC